jgi:hypothetical protein
MLRGWNIFKAVSGTVWSISTVSVASELLEIPCFPERSLRKENSRSGVKRGMLSRNSSPLRQEQLWREFKPLNFGHLYILLLLERQG